MYNKQKQYDWAAYQKEAYTFALYENTDYPALAVLEEMGELCGKYAKSLRGDKELDETGVLLEIGDILWNLAALASDQALPFTVPSIKSDDDQDPLDRPLHELAALSVSSFLNNNQSKCILTLHWIAKGLGSSLEDCAELNLKKLRDRRDRNKIKGEGDYR